jgi:hypothetical protein
MLRPGCNAASLAIGARSKTFVLKPKVGSGRIIDRLFSALCKLMVFALPFNGIDAET